MTEHQIMALIKANTSIPTRFVYAAVGVLALFFPGCVSVVFIKSLSNALQRLSFEERCALAALFRLD